MLKTSIDISRLPFENSFRKAIGIYLQRLSLILIVAIASLIILLLLTFFVSPSLRTGVFQGDTPSSVTSEHQNLTQEEIDAKLNEDLEAKQKLAEQTINIVMLTGLTTGFTTLFSTLIIFLAKVFTIKNIKKSQVNIRHDD